MNAPLLSSIIALSENRIRFLLKNNNAWYRGSMSHFEGIFHELEEVRIEIDSEKQVYLEDELGDVFWDFVCLLEGLEQEGKISKERVFERCYRKFSERLNSDASNNGDWQEIKQIQKERLKQEQESYR